MGYAATRGQVLRTCRIGIAAGLLSLPLLTAPTAALAAPPSCEEIDFDGVDYTVCIADLSQSDLRLFWSDTAGAPYRTFRAVDAALAGQGLRLSFAMNAGMYNDAGAPIGLYVENGDEQKAISLTDGPGNFHLKPNGVFWQGQDGTLHIDVSEDYALEMHEPRWATQSGPMLLIDGTMHPQFAEDGASRFIRNGVGVRDQHTAYFVISSGFVSFGRFARFFRDELNCRDALFLDGTVSSIWAPSVGRYDDNHELGPMVAVFDRD